MNIGGSEAHIDIYDDRMELYSLGEMPDDSMIQERNPLTVSSTRRNPVLADLFHVVPQRRIQGLANHRSRAIRQL